MKLLFENWQNYLKEQAAPPPQKETKQIKMKVTKEVAGHTLKKGNVYSLTTDSLDLLDNDDYEVREWYHNTVEITTPNQTIAVGDHGAWPSDA